MRKNLYIQFWILLVAGSILAQSSFAQVIQPSRSKLDIKPKAKTSTVAINKNTLLKRSVVTTGEIRISRSLAIKDFYKNYFRNVLTSSNGTVAPARKTTKTAVLPDISTSANDARLVNNEEYNSSEKLYVSDKVIVSNLYPNPANDFTNVDYEIKAGVGEVKLSFFSILGTQVKEIELDKFDRKQRIDIDNLPNGVYFYQLNIDGKTPVSRKLVVRHQ
jgi:Secretion system C-terminal sorting domain